MNELNFSIFDKLSDETKPVPIYSFRHTPIT